MSLPEDPTKNAFLLFITAPPTNQSAFHQWTVGTLALPSIVHDLTNLDLSPLGPIYYAPLILAEAFGPTNTAQIVDLNANNANIYTPAYAIYEQGNIARVALFNYMTDATGGHTYTASIAVGGGDSGQPNGTPASVKVKYLSAANVNQKDNITWAGQVCVDFSNVVRYADREIGLW